MKTRTLLLALTLPLTLSVAAALGCSKSSPAPVSTTLPGGDKVPLDTAPKESPRMVPQEAYIRTYLSLFGGLSPLAVQTDGKKANGLFDTWDDYLASLGLPDYSDDIPRGTETNSLMLATFERLGIALCDRAVARDLQATPPPAVADRVIFAFDLPAAPPDQAAFAERFEVLHRTFLGYPSALGPPDRVGRFFSLYQTTTARHQVAGAPASLFTPEQAGWAAVCYGLVRHPEFHTY